MLLLKKLQRCNTKFVSKFSSFGISNLPPPRGEKLLNYASGSSERAAVKTQLSKIFNECPEIPCIVNGEKILTGKTSTQVMPSMHSHAVCKYHTADEKLIQEAIKSSLAAKKKWENVSFENRAAVFYRAAEILKRDRSKICAAVMLGTGKNVWQAEIDAGAEAIDFLRFAPHFAQKIYNGQPALHTDGVYNRLEHRPLEGFVAAITPFNFCAIAINLPASPALMGNVSLWKPSGNAVLGNYLMMQAMEEAGLPPGVINFLPCASGAVFGETVLASPYLAGLHFTGSSEVFESLWKQVGENLPRYRNYPRVVGETGGKNFHFIHSSADPEQVLFQSIRGAFEYSGQKCSALSRLYVPKKMWEGGLKRRMREEVSRIKVGQPDDFDVFMTCVISQRSFDRARSFIEQARSSESCEILVGGGCDDSKGFFVEPTVIEVLDSQSRLLREEIFAPVLSVVVYEEGEEEAALQRCGDCSFGLTGSVFARDRNFVCKALEILRYSAGNFYVNDKCTGAVVGEQPFGGARRSGTNDKAGSELNLARWVTPRTIKENFVDLKTWKYPHMN